MKCDEIRKLLNPYVDNELDPADAGRVNKHLAECPACAKEVSDLQKIKNMLYKLPSVTAPAGLLERVRNNLARPNPEILPKNITFLRYRWLTLSLASAAAVILVVFTMLIQFRKSDMPSPEPPGRTVDSYTEKTKANLGAPALSETNVADASQAQPMLFTQQITISALDVNDTAAKIYAVASAQTPDVRQKSEYQRKQISHEELLAKALPEKIIQNENPTVSNSAAPLREQKTQSQGQLRQIVKISIPLSQKDAFIKQLRDDIPEKMVLAEIQTIYPVNQQDKLSSGYLADAKKVPADYEELERENEPADKNTNAYDIVARSGDRGLVAKKTEANKTESGKSSKAKDEESKEPKPAIADAGQGAGAAESPKDGSLEKPKSLPKTTTTTPSPPPSPAAPPPPSGFGQTLPKNDISRDDGMKEQVDADDAKNALSPLSRVELEPMIEFIIVIDPSGK